MKIALAVLFAFNLTASADDLAELSVEDRTAILKVLFQGVKNANLEVRKKTMSGPGSAFETWMLARMHVVLRKALLEGDKKESRACGPAWVAVQTALPLNAKDSLIVTSTECEENQSAGGGAFIATVPMRKTGETWKKIGEYKFRFEQGTGGTFGGELAPLRLGDKEWGLLSEGGFTNMGETSSQWRIARLQPDGQMRWVLDYGESGVEESNWTTLPRTSNGLFELTLALKTLKAQRTLVFRFDGKQYTLDEPKKAK